MRQGVLVDAHVHFHPTYSIGRFLHAAVQNFDRQARPGAARVLCLAEAAGANWFDALCDGTADLSKTGWRLIDTQEDVSRVLVHDNGERLILIAGHQLVAREDIEVLALGLRKKHFEGHPAAEIVSETLNAGALAVLPWGFGKWLGKRGVLVGSLLDTFGTDVLLGDNGGRLGGTRLPQILNDGAAAGHRLMPGSDPLPMRGEERSVASYGAYLPGEIGEVQPFADLRQLLLNGERPQQFGAGERPLRFLRNQLLMQVRKRRASPAATQQRPRLLALAPQPFFSPRGTPFSVYYRSLVIAELGYDIDLLTYGQGQDVDIPGVRILRGPKLDFLGAIRTGPSLLKAVHDAFMLVYFLWLIARNDYHLVHAHEESVFFAAPLKRILGFGLIYDMHSSLPEQLDNFDFSKSRLLRRAFEFLEQRSLLAADGVITICPALADQVEAVAPWAMDKHELIENSIFEPIRFTQSPAGAAELPDPAALADGRRAVVYAGTLESYQGIDILLEAIAELSQDRDDFALLVAGGRAEQIQAFTTQASVLGLGDRVRFLGQLPPEAARHLAQNADIILSPRSSGTNTPLKNYEQLACGVPLVATSIYSHTQVLDDSLAVLVEPSAAGLAEGIARLLDEPALGRRLVCRAQAHYAQHYARPQYKAKLARLLGKIA